MARDEQARRYVGTLVGESTSQEFRLAVAHDTIKEQDIIAVDAELRSSESQAQPQPVRVWAKVQRIERINPLFPAEAGHELAATKTNPFDTVLSLSREMVTAVCKILGSEPREAHQGGRLDRLRYPPQPASSAYGPEARDIARVVLGELGEKQRRALDIATLSNRPDVAVKVDGHAIVLRHLAVLAMTGAGKSWTVRRIIEELAAKKYPIVIFDPHGDYTGLASVPALRGHVTRYYARFPAFDEDSETVADIVNALGYPFTDTMRTRFGDVFGAAQAFYGADEAERRARAAWLSGRLGQPPIAEFGIKPDLWLVAHVAAVGEAAIRDGDDRGQLQDWGWPALRDYSKTDARTLEAIKKRTYRAAAVLQRMENTNKKVADTATPLPTDRTELVRYGEISVVSLAGYTGDFQATIYSIVAGDLLEARVSDELALPVLFVLEEAHTFAPARAETQAQQQAITITRQIAQEGRKFGVGLILISQRPSRLDETTLSQCNSQIIMRLVNPADQSFVRRAIESLGEDEARMLPDLDVGEAVLAGQLTSFPVLARMRPPASQGEREEEDAFEALEKARAQVRSSRG